MAPPGRRLRGRRESSAVSVAMALGVDCASLLEGKGWRSAVF